jgi:hypothetical protein
MEEKVKFALAIYRGLPDNERADRLREWRTMPGHDIRTLVALCEQHEIAVRLERDRLSAMELQLSEMRKQLETRTVQPDTISHYGQVQDTGRGRAAFGFAIVAGAVGGVCWMFFEFGVWPVVAGGATILFLSSLFGGGGWQKEAYPKEPDGHSGHTVVVNVNVGNGHATAQNG